MSDLRAAVATTLQMYEETFLAVGLSLFIVGGLVILLCEVLRMYRWQLIDRLASLAGGATAALIAVLLLIDILASLRVLVDHRQQIVALLTANATLPTEALVRPVAWLGSAWGAELLFRDARRAWRQP